jgi:hypothetical protein
MSLSFTEKYDVVVVGAGHAGDQILASDLFPGWQLPLRDLFDFRGRFK